MRSATPAADVPPPLGASSPIGPGSGVSVLAFVPSSTSRAPPNSFAEPGVCDINIPRGFAPRTPLHRHSRGPLGPAPFSGLVFLRSLASPNHRSLSVGSSSCAHSLLPITVRFQWARLPALTRFSQSPFAFSGLVFLRSLASPNHRSLSVVSSSCDHSLLPISDLFQWARLPALTRFSQSPFAFSGLVFLRSLASPNHRSLSVGSSSCAHSLLPITVRFQWARLPALTRFSQSPFAFSGLLFLRSLASPNLRSLSVGSSSCALSLLPFSVRFQWARLPALSRFSQSPFAFSGLVFLRSLASPNHRSLSV